MKEAGGYVSFLRAREAIDTRSRHERIWRQALQHVHASHLSDRTIRVLELGAGVGGLMCRLLAAFEGPLLDYTIVEIEQEHLTALEATLKQLTAEEGYEVRREGECWTLQKGSRLITIRLIRADVWDVLSTHGVIPSSIRADLVVGQAFLDLFDVERLLPRIIQCTAPGGGLYFPITFDGVTAWLPEHEEELDARVEHFYHASMDARRGAGEHRRRSQSGRHVMSWLSSCPDVAFWDAGASDWLVGGHPEDPSAAEIRLFLHRMLDGYEREAAHGAPEGFYQWLAWRRKQVDAHVAILMTHQLDLYARRHISERGALRDEA